MHLTKTFRNIRIRLAKFIMENIQQNINVL